MVNNASNPELIKLNSARSFGLIFTIGLTISIFSAQFSQGEDMGIFISVSALLGKGYKLYDEVFDIKDPFFFYSLAFFQKYFGLSALFYFDIFITALSFPLAFKLAVKLSSNFNVAFLSSLMFFLTLTGQFGSSLRSQVFAITLILSFFILLLEDRWEFAGVIFTLIFFTKLPLILIPTLVLILTLLGHRSAKNFTGFVKGALVSSVIFVLIMILRGEFTGYVRMVSENINYASNYQSIVGQKNGIVGHFEVWNGSELRFYSFLSCLLLVLILRKVAGIEANDPLFIFTVATNLGVGLFLLQTAMWWHHLQIISLYIFFDFLFLLSVFNSKHESLLKRNIISTKSIWSHSNGIIGGVIIVALVILTSNSGWVFPLKPESNLKSLLHPTWTKPVEITMLEEAKQKYVQGGSFARLGMNEDMGFGAFLPDEWRFKCSRLIISGSEEKITVDKFLKCLTIEPDVILIAPFYNSEVNRPGNYAYFFRESQQILREGFICQPGPVQKYFLCTKKNTAKL